MSMAIKYGLQKKAKKDNAVCEHGETDCEMCHGGQMMAEGGDVVDDMQLVDRIMKKRKGEPVADFEKNDFDVMDQKEVPDDANYTAENSGDLLGNEEMDENDRDLIARIMRSRAKKDKMPRPA